MQTIPESERVVAITAVPAHEGLDTVSIGHDETGGEHDFGRVLQVALGDEIFEPVDLADRNRQHQDHREAGVDSTRNEVGREDGGVPSGDDADREVETDNRVNGEHERRSESGKQEVHRLVTMPVAG